MRFLVDECTGPAVAQWLRNQSHVVFSVYDQARGMDDEAVLTKAESGHWILITNDKDFGEMVFRERRRHHGVVFLRLHDGANGDTQLMQTLRPPKSGFTPCRNTADRG